MLNEHQCAVRDKLLNEGLSEGAIDTLLRSRWAESTQTNLAAAWGQWARYCEACAQAGNPVDFLDPSPVELVEFLREVRIGRRREGSKQGVETTFSWVRGVRSAISATLALWKGHLSLGAHPLVSGYITALKNEDFSVLQKRGYRYDDTWDAELVFGFIATAHVIYDSLSISMVNFRKHLHRERDMCIAGGRLILACRSHDLSCVFRGQRSRHDCLRFWLAPEMEQHCPLSANRRVDRVGGEPEPPKGEPCGPFRVLGVSVRYFGPKQRNSMEVRSHGYTDWITVDSVVGRPGVCWASTLYWYVRVSEMMGLADDCLFLTTSGRKDKAGGKCTGLHAESLANVMARVMEKAGVPPEFRPHSARHAGMAHGKNALKMTDDQVMARSNVSGPTYRLHYSRQVRRQGFVPPVPADSVGYADLEPEPEVELAVRQLSADYDGP
jgi:hypothetical protein